MPLHVGAFVLALALLAGRAVHAQSPSPPPPPPPSPYASSCSNCPTCVGPSPGECKTCFAGYFLSGATTVPYPPGFAIGTCAACTICIPGEFNAGQACASPITPSVDTVDCQPCALLSTYSSTSGASSCSPCTTCGANQYTVADCTLSSNTVCRTCTTCPAKQYTQTPCTATADAVCTPCLVWSDALGYCLDAGAGANNNLNDNGNLGDSESNNNNTNRNNATTAPSNSTTRGVTRNNITIADNIVAVALKSPVPLPVPVPFPVPFPVPTPSAGPASLSNACILRGTYQLINEGRRQCGGAAEYLVYNGGSSKECKKTTPFMAPSGSFKSERSRWLLSVSSSTKVTSLVASDRNCPAGAAKLLEPTGKLGTDPSTWEILKVGTSCSSVYIKSKSLASSGSPAYLSASSNCDSTSVVFSSKATSASQRWTVRRV